MNSYWQIFSYFNFCINAKWIIYFEQRRYKQRHHFTNKGLYSQSYGLSSSHVRMWDLDHKEGWVPKNWCFRIVVLEKTLESPLDCKELKLVNPKGNQPWIFIGRTYAKAEAPIFWPPDVTSQLIRKDPDAGKDWEQEERGKTKDEMALPTQWTWVWANYRRWWRRGKPGLLPLVSNWATTQTQVINRTKSILLLTYVHLFGWLNYKISWNYLRIYSVHS